ARSLRAPSPFTSDPTSGVNGAPDVRRAMAPNSRAVAIGRVTVARKAWRRSRSLVAHSRVFGLAAVVGAANPWDAAQHENDDWSRARVRVYDRRNAAPRVVPAPTATVTCRVSDWRSDPITSTSPNSGCTREAVKPSAPVPGTMESAGTYTGRPASSGSVKRGVAT